MAARSASRWLRAFLTVLGVTVVGGRVAGAEATPYDRTIARVITLLPKRPAIVVVFDATEARPEVRQKLLTLDSFVTREGQAIYLVRQSKVLQGAVEGRDTLFDYMLATIIWHEMAHLSGADEHGARKAEQELWTRYVRDGVCDQMTALRYLRALAARPDDTVMAGMR